MEFQVKSKKYGIKTVTIDDEDWVTVRNYRWYLHYNRNIKNFYVLSFKDKHTLGLHRLVMGCPKGLIIDFINHNTLDNRKENLRICTNSEDQRNRKTNDNNKTSKFKGVTWKTKDKKFMAQINYNKKRLCLGFFDNEIDAANCYNNYAKMFYGEFAYINNIVENNNWFKSEK